MGAPNKSGPPSKKDAALIRSFTSRRLSALDAAASDPEVSDGDFRALFMISQALSHETEVAVLSDETLCDKVPRTDRFKLNDVRKRLERARWISVQRGHGAKASRYTVLSEKINSILDQQLILRDLRHERKKQRRLEYANNSAQSKTAVVAKSPRTRHGDVARPPHMEDGEVAKSPRRIVAELPPVHTQGTYSPASLPVPNKTPSHKQACANLTAVATCSGPVEVFAGAGDGGKAILIGPQGANADFELLHIIGGGSWTRGTRLKPKLPGFVEWSRLLAERGLTAGQVALIQSAAARASKTPQAAVFTDLIEEPDRGFRIQLLNSRRVHDGA